MGDIVLPAALSKDPVVIIPRPGRKPRKLNLFIIDNMTAAELIDKLRCSSGDIDAFCATFTKTETEWDAILARTYMVLHHKGNAEYLAQWEMLTRCFANATAARLRRQALERVAVAEDTKPPVLAKITDRVAYARFWLGVVDSKPKPESKQESVNLPATTESDDRVQQLMDNMHSVKDSTDYGEFETNQSAV